MRVIAGMYRSRILKSLKGAALRPTSDRLRETLFNVLAQVIPGARFVDVFAGTGAVGIEALSRGAEEVVFIEDHAPAAALIRKNLESLDVRYGVTVIPLDALRGLEKLDADSPSGSHLEIVFLDPPYAATEDYARVLSFLSTAQFLHEGSIVIAEHRRNFEFPARLGNLERVRMLKQGDACLTFFRRLARISF
ncbi:MAG: 16S rRNA (guanine(966)-N(2))-methyltransferase RsmD [Candidatus Acidiferrum sp.]